MGLFNATKPDVSNNGNEKPELGKIYCIDFENTQDSGIIGISKLNEQDEVVIFYGSNNNSISFVSHEMIVLAKCKVTIFKCDKSAKNYLDFQLISYLGKRIGQEKFEKVVIVSKDMGYDAVVDFWIKENINISRQEAIDENIKSESKFENQKQITKNKSIRKKQPKNKNLEVQKENENKQKISKENVTMFPEEFKKKIRNAVKNEGLKPTQYTTIYNCVMRSKSVDEYRRIISKRFGEKSGDILDCTDKIFEEYLSKQK